MGPHISGDVFKTVLWQSCQESDKEGITGWQILTERYHRSPFQPGRGWISPRVGEAYLLWKGLQWPIHSQTGLVAADHVWLGSSKTGLTTLTQVVVAPLVDRGESLEYTKTLLITSYWSRHDWGAQETVWGCAENDSIAVFENWTFRSPDSSVCCQAALSESCRQQAPLQINLPVIEPYRRVFL